jgi:ATP-dependent DNA helicase RecQ
VEIRDLAAALRTGPQTKTALKGKTGLGPRKLGQMLGLLERVGAATAGEGNKWTVPVFAPLPAAAAEAAIAEYERQQVVQRSRMDMMRGFAQTRGCRSQILLAYFGERLKNRCGHCDNCVEGVVSAATTHEPFPVHGRVRHAEWGAGMVMGYEHERMTVLFDEVGYKTLSVPVVVEQSLLTRER